MKKILFAAVAFTALICGAYELQFRKNFSEISAVSSGIVNIERLNVRSGPSTVYPRIDVLYIGDRVNIRKAVSDTWLEIVLPPITGYVHSDFLDIADTRENLVFDFDTSELFTDYSLSTEEVFGIVNANSVNVRAEPNTEAARKAIVNKKVRLRILAKKGDWFEISFLSNRDGYVYSRYISPERKAVITKDLTPMFTSPKAGSGMVRYLSEGENVSIFEKKESFFRVFSETDRKCGWIPQESVVE